jgi:hypothetical protein
MVTNEATPLVGFSKGQTQYLEASELEFMERNNPLTKSKLQARNSRRHFQNLIQQQTSLELQVWDVLSGGLQIPGALYHLGLAVMSISLAMIRFMRTDIPMILNMTCQSSIRRRLARQQPAESWTSFERGEEIGQRRDSNAETIYYITNTESQR